MTSSWSRLSLRTSPSLPWASYQIRKIASCACAGNAGNVFPRGHLQRKPIVSDPGMHYGTCVTHVPWCMLGSLTRGGGENVPGIPGACAPAILRNWQEAHTTYTHTACKWLWSDVATRIRDHFVFASSQREMTLHCNSVSHWLGAYTKWSLKNAKLCVPYLCILRNHFTFSKFCISRLVQKDMQFHYICTGVTSFATNSWDPVSISKGSSQVQCHTIIMPGVDIMCSAVPL